MTQQSNTQVETVEQEAGRRLRFKFSLGNTPMLIEGDSATFADPYQVALWNFCLTLLREKLEAEGKMLDKAIMKFEAELRPTKRYLLRVAMNMNLVLLMQNTKNCILMPEIVS